MYHPLFLFHFLKLEIQLGIFRQVVFGVGGRFQYVIESPLADTIHRIYVPPPYLPVRDSLLDVEVIYLVDVSDALLITHTVPIPHIAILSVHNLFTFWLVRTDIKRHLAAHRHTAAPFTLRAGFSLADKTPGYDFARAVAFAAQGHFRVFLHFLFHCSAVFRILSFPTG